MLHMSAKSVFGPGVKANELLVKQAVTNFAPAFAQAFLDNVRDITPRKTAALRRSIVTQKLGYEAKIGWRLPYAIDQERGYSVPGHPYKNYSTPGTQAHFAETAMKRTIAEIDPLARELGLKK